MKPCVFMIPEALSLSKWMLSSPEYQPFSCNKHFEPRTTQATWLFSGEVQTMNYTELQIIANDRTNHSMQNSLDKNLMKVFCGYGHIK